MSIYRNSMYKIRSNRFVFVIYSIGHFIEKISVLFDSEIKIKSDKARKFCYMRSICMDQQQLYLSTSRVDPGFWKAGQRPGEEGQSPKKIGEVTKSKRSW